MFSTEQEVMSSVLCTWWRCLRIHVALSSASWSRTYLLRCVLLYVTSWSCGNRKWRINVTVFDTCCVSCAWEHACRVVVAACHDWPYCLLSLSVTNQPCCCCRCHDNQSANQMGFFQHSGLYSSLLFASFITFTVRKRKRETVSWQIHVMNWHITHRAD